jgi:hypothetical protein
MKVTDEMIIDCAFSKGFKSVFVVKDDDLKAYIRDYKINNLLR